MRFLLALTLFSYAASTSAAKPAPEYVGRAQCIECHADQNDRWTGSHHDLAMQEATRDTVLGDFNDAEFEQFGVVSRFFRRGDRLMVRTDGPDGRLRDYPIKYTFGVFPLQQYLIEFPGGRLQALDIAWDSRPRAQGGQRWFHLHPEDPVRHDDVLHWTGPNLNWNYMCADCHSTHLKKNYDATADSYHTTWSEIDVSCEACHGPGSAHLKWAKAGGESADQPDMGLTVRFNERVGITWSLDQRSGRVRRSAPRRTQAEIQVCARCHSRRGQLTDETVPGQPFMNGYRPALLSEGLYHPDGQIQDEVYVWGSFLQSKMHRAGVTCSDCHDPHRADLRLPGEQVCYQCHRADRYASKTHHFHPPESTGASCVECHMPATDYMVVDPRHDHGFRIPRPDLSVTMDTPNACNQCHMDKSPDWAAQRVETWYGHPPRGLQRFAPALHAARRQLPEAGPLLRALAADADQPMIARATALSSLAAYPDRQTLELIQQGLSGEDPLERLGALEALDGSGPARRMLAFPLLWDEARAVRIEAARLLAALPRDRLSEAHKTKLDQAIEEYLTVQRFNAERPEAQLNLGNVYAELGHYADAEQAYRKALRLQPRFIPVYVNLAQLLSNREREREGEGVLRRGLERNPDNAVLYHALGLSLVRQKQPVGALEYFAKAAKLAPDVPRYGYVHGVALQSAGKLERAIQVLEAAHRRHPGNGDILYALATFNRDAGRGQEALRYAKKLSELAPNQPAIQQLVRELQRAGS